MKKQKYGIEIEFTGITRKAAAETLSAHFGTTFTATHDCYDTYKIPDSQGRNWKIVRDASIRIECGEQCELVSPICQYTDIETIQELVRKLRTAGGKANSSCGIHIHINAAPHTARSIRNIANIMTAKEDLIFKALQVDEARTHYCKKVEDSFIEEINRKKPQTLEAVKNLWYNGNDGSWQHYHESRYHALNLHSVFQKGTIEFRMFNSTLTHAGKVKAYIQFCLAISHQALTQTSASKRKTSTTNDKYTFRTWLLRLGLIGDEFKTARLHLLANLEGDIAWRRAA
jgi:hypothetical protein